jgi:hypothetical protein
MDMDLMVVDNTFNPFRDKYFKFTQHMYPMGDYGRALIRGLFFLKQETSCQWFINDFAESKI